MASATTVLSTDDIRAMVLPLLAKYDMRSASLFGSYARGEADGDSDIDLIIEGNPGFRPLNIFGVAEDLHRLSGKRVDVFEMSELDAGPFRDTVLREAVAL
ncbi:nucleotidyltransferase domain-containing protein [Adlercreutzia sp. R21]|uniref:Nucleotidyltransferase domain-containing protein n=1 Tax=Adlercreutzia wanghongyangiae TaxID=3111451 RepID=A0ABU6II56_9ACTN|nr:nucleotidyltransferase domain-containing protein [Adlercreutzia sp. R21]MEC4176144.1 nucleotidyltransferase domain-containing protein [Adlercreutzia sp. R7]MEC4183996.1 nucleotidyltransferase domain-containing protein [Adlercreutzia sp. R21]